MAIRIGTLRTMDRFSLNAMLDNIIGRTLIVILNTALGGMVLLLVFLLNPTQPQFLMKLAVVGAVGMLAGFSSRRFLKEYDGLIRLLAAMLAMVISLFILQIFSFGFMGIEVVMQNSSEPNWDSLIQIGLGILSSLLALYAWQDPLPDDISIDLPESQQVFSSNPGISAPQEGNRVNPRRRGTLRAIGTNTGSHNRAPSHRGILSPPSPNGRSGMIKRRRLPKIIGGNNRRLIHQVKIATQEEHRCPFCLEPVVFGDPRGVETCSICHTHHHADCWDITGVCQIPHYQE